jgi:hypothetical protein
MVAARPQSRSSISNLEVRQTLGELQTLFEKQARTFLKKTIAGDTTLMKRKRLDPKPDKLKKQNVRLTAARTITAYRDHYQIIDNHSPIGLEPGEASLIAEDRRRPSRSSTQKSAQPHAESRTDRKGAYTDVLNGQSLMRKLQRHYRRRTSACRFESKTYLSFIPKRAWQTLVLASTHSRSRRVYRERSPRWLV